MTSPVMSDKWNEAQTWEQQWWQNSTNRCTNTWDEEQKQLLYAGHMGLTVGNLGHIEVYGKSILDIGGGPVSMLLKTVNAGRRKVIDPMQMEGWVLGRYAAAGIEFEQKAGEFVDETGWDEVWLYNVLQHTDNWEMVLRSAAKAGKLLRIFEWVHVPVSDGHINTLTVPEICKVLEIDDVPEPLVINWSDNTCNFAFAAMIDPENDYVAAVPKYGVPGIERPKQFTFHIPGLPHTKTNDSFCSCAYTIKAKRLCSMLTKLGHKVYHYGIEGATVECTEDVVLVSDEYWQGFYGGNYDTTKQYHYDTTDKLHSKFVRRAVYEIEERLGEDDFMLCPWGWGHKPIADKLPSSVMVVESGIGYPDTFADYKVFESYSWMHYVYGKLNSAGKFYDAVIPNYFDPNDFEYSAEKDDYILYLGRIVKSKGVELAVNIAEQLGQRLIIAGQGTLKNDAEGIDLKGDNIEFVGHADVTMRKQLLKNAKALICPTYYVEPFGGVSIEAMMSGTPVISTDYGAFADNVLHGITGYRCHTFEQFLWAVENIENINPQSCRDWAMDNFSCDRVAQMYQEYFTMLYGLRGPGMPELKDRDSLDWLYRKYPTS